MRDALGNTIQAVFVNIFITPLVPPAPLEAGKQFKARPW